MWTKIPQMCFRIHFREQNCKTALVEKIPKEPVTFFLFHFRHLSDPIHYYPLLLCLEFWPPPLFLFSWYIQSKKREQGGFRTTIPSFQIFAFNYFLSIFAALFPSSVRVPEKQSHSVFLPSPNSTFLQYSMRIATPLIFVPWKTLCMLLAVVKVFLKFEKSGTGSWSRRRGFFFICNPLLHFTAELLENSSRDASAPKHSNVLSCVTSCDDAYKPTVRIMTCLQHLHFLQRVLVFTTTTPFHNHRNLKMEIDFSRNWNHLSNAVQPRVSHHCHIFWTELATQLVNFCSCSSSICVSDLCYWCI